MDSHTTKYSLYSMLWSVYVGDILLFFSLIIFHPIFHSSSFFIHSPLFPAPHFLYSSAFIFSSFPLLSFLLPFLISPLFPPLSLSLPLFLFSPIPPTTPKHGHSQVASGKKCPYPRAFDKKLRCPDKMSGYPQFNLTFQFLSRHILYYHNFHIIT